MYALLTAGVQATLSLDSFTRAYQDALTQATVNGLSVQVRSVLQQETTAQAAVHVTWQTKLFGPLSYDLILPLSLETPSSPVGGTKGGTWRVAWSLACIHPALRSTGYRLQRLISPPPARANIYDRNGLGLAVEGSMVTVGVVPGRIQDEQQVLSILSSILGQDPMTLRSRYISFPPDWFVPLGDLTPEAAQVYYQTLEGIEGIEMREKPIRTYRDGGIAPHLVGYLGVIGSEELAYWQSQGYQGDELVGQSGVERWGEIYLAGQRGSRLVVLDPRGRFVTTLAERPVVPGRSIYTTLDRNLQQAVEAILGDRTGAIVVLDPHNGQVLAMASSPAFDPNLFATGIAPETWEVLANDPRRPLLNRATQGTYPPGSVFKIITMAAVLETGLFTPQSTFTCTGLWTGLGPEWAKPCWLRRGHGTIDLVTALAASCDYTFYELGLQLYNHDPNVLPHYARLFGLGRPTGLEAASEAAGLVPDDAWKRETTGEGWAPGDNVNLAIGQGFLVVTPLQIAVMLAAIGNGGTIYRPQAVLRVAASPGEPEVTFPPQAVGQLPLTPEHLQAIRQGLLGATTDPRGTATHVFQGLGISVAGKTGTAQVDSGEAEPHAWFAGYAPAEDPQIAVVVVVEHGGEGSKAAAPLFRQVIETYFGLTTTPTP